MIVYRQLSSQSHHWTSSNDGFLVISRIYVIYLISIINENKSSYRNELYSPINYNSYPLYALASVHYNRGEE